MRETILNRAPARHSKTREQAGFGKPAALALAAVLTLAVVMTQAAQAQTLKVVYTFGGTDGRQTNQENLIQGMNGDLYGTTQGGLYGYGSVFKMTPAGGALTTLYSFCATGTEGNCVDAGGPGAIVQGTNGNIYGTTEYGGAFGNGVVFVMSPNGGGATAPGQFQPLSLDPDGLYVNASGANPVGAMVQATNGVFWGVSQGGGALGQGTKFEMTPAGGFGSVVAFPCIQGSACNANPCGQGVDCPGNYLVAGLIQATDGNFYGTTQYGGTDTYGGGEFTGGTVFKISGQPGANQNPSILYSFCSLSDCADGQDPTAALVEGNDGNFYGTTYYGGTGTFCPASGNGLLGCGTVFQITPSGTLTTLHSFCTIPKCVDGAYPIAGLILGSDGNFYGTASYGGRAGNICSDYVCGTIFEITRSGTLTPLHDFCFPNEGNGCPSGAGPAAPLVQYTNGDFYGTTTSGGPDYSCCGTIFRLSTGLSPFVKTLPTAGLVGAKALILGTDLTGATSVSFNGTAASYTVESSTLITATVPAGATSGRVQVITPSATLTSNVPYVVEP